MYISLADSRANGFVRWADAFQPEKLGDARDGAGEGGAMAARALAQGGAEASRTAASSVARARRR